jgi:protein-disulfide isomerase
MHTTRSQFALLVRVASVTAIVLTLATGLWAQNVDAWYPIKGDDGSEVTNYRVPVELESQIEELPGAVVVGNAHGDVTLVEFYDLNCPFCRKAASDIEAMVRADDELRLVLVPFPVLGIPSIQAGRVELAVGKLVTPEKFYEFHRRIYAGRGVIDGDRALAVAKQLGLSPEQVIKVANDDAITETMKAHVRLGNSLGLTATPGLVIKGAAILGYPGKKTLANIVKSIRTCDQVTC